MRGERPSRDWGLELWVSIPVQLARMKGFCLAGLVSPMHSIGLFYGYVLRFIIIFVFSLVDVYSAFAFGGESRIFAGVVCTDVDPALSHVQSAARRGESGGAEVDGEDVE